MCGVTTQADQLRDRLRTDLLAARKARSTEVVAALRTGIAALDNAEAVAPLDPGAGPNGEHVAGAVAGLGAAEAERRQLTLPEVRQVLRDEVEERRSEADRYDTLGRPDDAARLRRDADALALYLG